MSDIIIIRDARESPRKCTVAPLRGTPGIEIRGWRRESIIEIPGVVTLLHHEGTPLSPADHGRPLLLVDSSWNHLPQVLADLRGTLERRSIPPGFVTAYPRKSRLFSDPEGGLATVEALHIARCILGLPSEGLLQHYYFREEFLSLNRPAFERLAHGPGSVTL